MTPYVPERPLLHPAARLRRAVGWLAVLGALSVLLGAVVAARAAYADGLDRVARETATRTTVVATLLEDVDAAAVGPPAPVRVRYLDPAGHPRVGQIEITGRLRAGTPVRVEADAAGIVGTTRPTGGDALIGALAAGTAVAVLGGGLLLLLVLAGRAALAARAAAAWDREWRAVEPRWSGRVP
jgi:hypothetical protein